MNKDALLATLIGFGIGLLITGILLLSPNIIKMFPAIKLPTVSFPQNQKTAPLAPTPTPKAAFAIESPLPEAIESAAELLVSGTAPAGATVVIAGPSDESAAAVGSDGKFAGKLTLVEGKNDITVTSISAEKSSTLSVTVYYSQENL